MDVWVNFTNATKWQAEGIFKCFFPSKPSKTESSEPKEKETSQKNIPGSKVKASIHAVPLLDESEIALLAKRFADSIPEDELSVSSCQCFQGSVLTSLFHPGREFAGIPFEEQDKTTGVRGRGHRVVYVFSGTFLSEMLTNIHSRIQQERETRARLKKEKEEVSALL
jgi:hypothetical protein